MSTEKTARSLDAVPSSSSSGDSSAYSYDFDSDSDDGVEFNPKKKKQRVEAVLPVGFLDPIKPGLERTVVRSNVKVKEERVGSSNSVLESAEKWKKKEGTAVALVRNCRQFWKAGDYETGCGSADDRVYLADMDHVRVHPRFLHSNATSHKWALGAFAELLDNALDEVCNGATYVSVDVWDNKKDNSKMVVVQDNGGGMTPDKMRQCMSLGYSAKSKMAKTIGQYGNGFKTSTMRLGADVIVFSRCLGKCEGRTTQSIGLLSYTFLQNTGKEDIVVPMIDYERVGQTWNKHVKSSIDCWQRNLETIVQWSPFDSEEDLLQQFNVLEDQGTCIIIYNLWEDDQGSAELDFNADRHDIQIRGASRDKKKIEMAQTYPSCRHFLTYRHSLRSYASILYRKVPPGFRIILREKDVDHHNIVDDLIHSTELVYKPAALADTTSRDSNKSPVVTIGFVKDARHHIDVQGFNVYHKNRLIKPFWRVWNAAGSDGRGVIGVLEANFVEPAHDKQGFERTVALSRLEARLIHFQKSYWSSNCHLVGYARRHHPRNYALGEKEASAGAKGKSNCKKTTKVNISNGASLPGPTATSSPNPTGKNELASSSPATKSATMGRIQMESRARNHHNLSSCKTQRPEHSSDQSASVAQTGETNGDRPKLPPWTSNLADDEPEAACKLKEENQSLKNRLKRAMQDLQYEKDKNKSLQNQLEDTKIKLNKTDSEQEVFVSYFAEERSRRDQEEQNMRQKLKEASETIRGLLDKVKMLDAARSLH